MTQKKTTKKTEEPKHIGYLIQVYQDGELAGVFHFDSAIIAVETWNKFNDYGDAQNYRAVTFEGANGEIHHKHFPVD